MQRSFPSLWHPQTRPRRWTPGRRPLGATSVAGRAIVPAPAPAGLLRPRQPVNRPAAVVTHVELARLVFAERADREAAFDKQRPLPLVPRFHQGPDDAAAVVA